MGFFSMVKTSFDQAQRIGLDNDREAPLSQGAIFCTFAVTAQTVSLRGAFFATKQSPPCGLGIASLAMTA